MYLKIETVDKTYLKFVTSKKRVAPLVGQTIPRLELLLALILARLISHVRTVSEELIPISRFRGEPCVGFVEKTVSGKSLFRTGYVRSDVLSHQLRGVIAQVKAAQLI